MSIRTRLKSAIDGFRFGTRTNLRFVDGAWWWGLTSNTCYKDLNLVKDFMEVPELNAVLNRKARMWSRMTLKVISKQTGEEMQNRQDLIKLLRNPNWYQAQREFLFQTKLFREIHGNEYLFFDKWAGAPFRMATGLYTLPPANVIVKTPHEKPFFMYKEPVVSYEFEWKGTKYPLLADSIIQFNDNRVDIKPESWVTGQSKMEAIKVPINNIRAAYESRNQIIRYRGAAGFISPEKDPAGSLPLDANDQDAIQEQWRKYGTGKDQFQFAFSPVAIKFQSVGVNDPAKLGLFVETEADFQKICDAYGMDRDLFSNEKGATWENKKQGERQTWNNTIIPEALEWVDGLNDVFGTGNESWMLVANFVDIPVLQENIAEKGQAIKQITDSLSVMLADRVITPEEYQKELNKLGFELTELPKEVQP